MADGIKKYIYRKGEAAEVDQEFQKEKSHGSVRFGDSCVFWKKGFRWYMVETDQIRRAYRRIEAVDSKRCCGSVNFDIQKLVLILKDDTRLELMIGEGVPKEAEALYQEMQEKYPQLEYGKPKEWDTLS